MRTAVHSSLLSTLLLAVVAWPSASFGVVACDGDTVRALSGCTGAGFCVVTLDITCDDSCGAECVYDFPQGFPILRGVFRSTGPDLRFVGGFIDLFGPSGKGIGGSGRGTENTRIPGIETVPGGVIRFEVIVLAITRPIRAPGGTVEIVKGAVESPLSAETFRHAKIDVSGEAAGGTIRFKEYGFSKITLLARGLGPEAPGGNVVIETRSFSELNSIDKRVHRIDVSGATGGTVVLGRIERAGHILAHGRKGDGGFVDIEGVDLSEPITLGDCFSPRGRIRVDGRGRGGMLLVKNVGPLQICQRVDASGGDGGGVVRFEASSIRFWKIKAKGKRGTAGGTVELLASSSAGGLNNDRIDVRGAPGGTVWIRGDEGGAVTTVLADATKKSAAAGTIFVGELNDPPTGNASAIIRKRASAQSKQGAGGAITLRGCGVKLDSNRSTVEVNASGGGTGGTVVYQSRSDVRIPDQTLALGPGGSIRIEYATSVDAPGTFQPDPQLLQYPNPDCDCTMTLAECMTAP